MPSCEIDTKAAKRRAEPADEVDRREGTRNVQPCFFWRPRASFPDRVDVPTQRRKPQHERGDEYGSGKNENSDRDTERAQRRKLEQAIGECEALRTGNGEPEPASGDKGAQRDDKGDDAEAGDKKRVHRAEDESRSQAGQKRHKDRCACAQHQPRDHRRDVHDAADREVDARCEQHESHADRQDADVRRLIENEQQRLHLQKKNAAKSTPKSTTISTKRINGL